MIPGNDAVAGDLDSFVAFTDAIRKSGKGSEKLVLLLHEKCPLYRNKSANEVIRIRAYIIYSFTFTGLPNEGLPFIYEELQSNKEPYLVAAAAVALRHAQCKRSDMADALVQAFYNVRSNDSAVSFESFAPVWPVRNYTTAVTEILMSLTWLGCYAKHVIPELVNISSIYSASGSMAARLQKVMQDINDDAGTVDDCCYRRDTDATKVYQQGPVENMDDVYFENYNGERLSFDDVFRKKLSLVAFFYTRCDNPLKCSLTITNMGRIQQLLSEQLLADDVNLVAITYDPVYDQPHLLRSYAEARGMKLNNNTYILRASGGHEKVQEYFNLGVSYAGSVVTRHVIELYLLNAEAQICNAFQREKIDNCKVVDSIKSIVAGKPVTRGRSMARIRHIWQSFASVVTPALVMFLPKCPLCLAGYFSVFGIIGVEIIPYIKYVFPVLAIIIGLNLLLMFRAARRRNGYFPFFLSAGGAMLVLLGYLIKLRYAQYAGISLMIVASLLNSVSFIQFQRWKFGVRKLLSVQSG